jgi:hypothetical protein
MAHVSTRQKIVQKFKFKGNFIPVLVMWGKVGGKS